MSQPVYPIEYPDCPSCGAKAGKYCKRPSGHSGPFVSPHAARTKAAGGAVVSNAAEVPYPSGYPECPECGVEEGANCKTANGRTKPDPHKSRETRMKVEMVLPTAERKGNPPPFGHEEEPPAKPRPVAVLKPVIEPSWFEVLVDGRLAGNVFMAKGKGWRAETPDRRIMAFPARDHAVKWLEEQVPA